MPPGPQPLPLLAEMYSLAFDRAMARDTHPVIRETCRQLLDEYATGFRGGERPQDRPELPFRGRRGGPSSISLANLIREAIDDRLHGRIGAQAKEAA